MRYLQSMTGLLEKALQRVEALSSEEQDAIASQILETLEDEEAWARKFREKPELLRSLAREAIEAISRRLRHSPRARSATSPPGLSVVST
jgi:hypothetical protein